MHIQQTELGGDDEEFEAIGDETVYACEAASRKSAMLREIGLRKQVIDHRKRILPGSISSSWFDVGEEKISFAWASARNLAVKRGV